jgi:hypothetical protein
LYIKLAAHCSLWGYFHKFRDEVQILKSAKQNNSDFGFLPTITNKNTYITKLVTSQTKKVV